MKIINITVSAVIKKILLLFIIVSAVFPLELTAQTVIKFYTASWCPWCAKQAPIVNQIEMEGKAKVSYINKDSGGMILPQITIVKDGKVVKTFIGFTPYENIAKVL